MNRRKALIGTFTAATSATATAGVMDWFNNVKVGAVLPEFDAEYLLAEPVQDRKLLLIDFWATWCAPCREEFPHLNALSQAFASSGLEVIGLTQESKSVALAFVPKVDIRYKLGAGGAKPLQKTLGVKALPYALVADRSNRILWRGQASDIRSSDVHSWLRSAV